MNDDLARAGWRQGRDGRWYPPDPDRPEVGPVPEGAGGAAGGARAPEPVLLRTGLLDAPVVIRRAVVEAPALAPAGARRTRQVLEPSGVEPPEPDTLDPDEVPTRRPPSARTLALAGASVAVGLFAIGLGVLDALDDEPPDAAPVTAAASR